VSENGTIEIFHPRISPSQIEGVNENVVFGISGKLLHNYLLPRDCPRVTYYATNKTTLTDRQKFLRAPAAFVVAIEAKWFSVLQQTILYVYEFDDANFILIDECAGYYVSYKAVKPIRVKLVDNILAALFERKNIELKVVPNLWSLAEDVTKSTLNYSLIRMRNAAPPAR